MLRPNSLATISQILLAVLLFNQAQFDWSWTVSIERPTRQKFCSADTYRTMHLTHTPLSRAASRGCGFVLERELSEIK
jgi:hypothetical protein